MKPFEKVLGTLAFQPMRLGGTPFADYRLLGALPDIGGDKRGAAALRRYFSGANGELVELFEWDTSLGGGAYLLDPTRQTEKVNGHPAALTILQSKGGKAFSVLSWDRNRRHIELGVNRNVRAARHADFIRLAESLPAPSPAEPDAPMPEVDFPPPFGPGAPFPPHPPK